MRRYFIDSQMIQGEYVILEGDTLHHIRDVCRQHKGSKFEVITSENLAYFVEVVDEAKKRTVAKILEQRELPPLPVPHLHLVLSVPKFPVFESLLEKMVELGVSDIHLVYSDFSFIRSQTDVIQKKWARWEKIVRGACQQSGRGQLLKIHTPRLLKEVVNEFKSAENVRGLFLYEGAAQVDVQAALRSGLQNGASVWLFVGSEGGFSVDEVKMFHACGLPTVTLGDQVLRVETACVAAVSILKYELGLMRHPAIEPKGAT